MKRSELEKRECRNFAKARLAHWIQFCPRKPGNVVPFTAAENDIICLLSWQAWGWIVDKLGRGTVDDLKGFVAEPEELIAHRKEIAAVFQDAVPVYLDLSCGKIIVRYSELDGRRPHRLQPLRLRAVADQLGRPGR